MAFSYTLKQLIRRTAMLYLDDWKEGTLTSTSGTNLAKTFIDTSRNEKDDFFQNTTPVSWFHVLTTTDGLAPQGEEKDIADWTLATTTGLLRADLTATLHSGDTYGILSKFRWFEIKEAINEAIDIASTRMFIEKLTETTVMVASTYEYDVTGFSHIYRVTLKNADANFLYEVPPSQYEIVRGSSKIKLLTYPVDSIPEGHQVGGMWADDNLVAGSYLRIEGLSKQASLSADTSTCVLDPDFICAYAAHRLLIKRGNRSDLDPDNKASRAAYYKTIADKLLLDNTTRLPPNTKRVEL